MFFYIVSGLSLASEIALPGLIAGPVPPDEPDVTIRQGSVPPELDNPIENGPNWQFADEQFLLRVPGIVDMLLIAGRAITFELSPLATIDDALPFLNGTGLGILLHQRGHFVLHASAVRVGNRAMLFCGPSGAGKSTIAAALVEAGFDLMTDDFCALSTTEGGHIMAEPDGRQLKLWELAIDKLSLKERRLDSVRPDLEKFYVTPRSATSTSLPLGGVYQLVERRLRGADSIDSLNIVEGAVAIRRNAYRPGLVAKLRQQELYFRMSASISRQAGVFRLSRELGFGNMEKVLASLREHWSNLGLLEAID